jgi:hypothetical protein
MPYNNSLKPTITRVTLYAVEKQIPVPRYGGLIPPFYSHKGYEYNIA